VTRPRLHWGFAVAAVYTLFAGSTLGFVVFALSHPVELVSADYYERSLAHDARLAARARAAALGGDLQVAVDAPGRALAIALPASHAATARGQVTLYRPSDAHADRVVTLAPDGEGRQRVPLSGLARGRWLLRVDWTAAGIAYSYEQPLVRP
jgi:nitrogen fixation protein FixH